MVLADFGGKGNIDFGNMDASNLSTGTKFDPKDIRGKVNQWVKQNAHLPSQINPADLLRAAKEKEGSDYAAFAAQEMANLKTATANNVVGIEQSASNYGKAMMKLDQRIQGVRADYGRAEVQYGVQSGITAAGFEGYKAAAQNHWDF